MIFILLACSRSWAIDPVINHVIHISVDGLRPDAVTTGGASNLPNFYRLRTQGAFTDNARTDFDWTVTLPNHASQLTGRAVEGSAGHNWTFNSVTTEDQTLASNKGQYVAGVFDVVHDRGLRTGFFASKAKFSIFQRSWNSTNGALDSVDADNGRNKIDVSELTYDTTALANALVTNMATQPFHYAFLHYADTDLNGHSYGWDINIGTPYAAAVMHMDSLLGQIFAVIDAHPQLSNHTAIILTSDHGGANYDHSDPLLQTDYTIPFYVWSPTAAPGQNLYTINAARRANPGASRPDYAQPNQPIRNGDAANLALMLLGLRSVPGSTINATQHLSVSAPFSENFRLTLAGDQETFTFSTRSNLFYDIQRSTNFPSGAWVSVAQNIPGNGGFVTNTLTRPVDCVQEFFRLRIHP